MIDLLGYQLTLQSLLLLGLVGLLVGIAKTGVHGAGMIAVPILAIAFGGKVSSGILLPILILADIMGVYHYHRHAEWKYLKKLIPFALFGVLFGTYYGTYLPDDLFRQMMAIIIFVSLAIMLWMEKFKAQQHPKSIWFTIILGIAGGFTTMVGNLAGSVMAIYFLSMKMLKNEFIGTTAWFFLIINLFKVPFHIYVWRTITLNSILLDLTVLPIIALGAFLGVQIVKRIPESIYRAFIILMTGLAALFMLT